jgi:RHS repeat-associated protein
MDRLTQEEGFDQRLQTYRWDAAGQLLEASDGSARQQQSTNYRWDAAGRLAQRRLPATEAAPAQVHGYEWDPAGRLMAASVHLLKESGEQAQSRIEIERDVLGRITGETQRLYRIGQSGQPEIEFEHTIAHQLDALGNRQASQLQGVGAVEWLLYGSGHVHGLQHNGSALIDFERDSLHRETGRTLQGQGGQTLTIRRRWDALGRLQALDSQGLQGQAQVPQVLIGQISQRQYHYDALGQLTAVQTAQDTLRYGYDAAGRLRAMQEGGQQQRWDVDPAGNRLPKARENAQGGAIDWASQVYAHWRQQDFNLLGQAQASTPGQGPITRWPDNRIGFSEQAAWRYDACGNRVEQLTQDGQRQRLGYDGGHQLIEVVSEGPAIGEQAGGGNSTSRYTYDALGRRLKKTSQTSSGHAAEVEHTNSYYGWDGDRLIHTEHTDALKPEHRQITHTVYEPGSFTPLVQLSTRGKEQTKQHALMLAVQGDDDGDDEANAQMAQMLAALPQDMRHLLDRSIRQAAREGMPEHILALMPDQGQSALRSTQNLREQLEKQEQSQRTEITVRHYHCDHLGTPLALTDESNQIVWAARLDPWGNVQEEFNPQHISQPIRLPGQHHDKDTGLYYNRHRYYDPSIGSYVNQDPIGLRGSRNQYSYPLSPYRKIDPLGLFEFPIYDGKGDTSVCGYYDGMAKEKPQCSYYPKASLICKGENKSVNSVIKVALAVESARQDKPLMESVILTSIRGKLVSSDKAAQAARKVDNNGCTQGNEIDAYHDRAFKESGVSPGFYGGNLWPQGTWPNPVPLDPSASKYDPRRLWN